MNTPEEKQVFTLLQVCTSIQKSMRERYKSLYWIKAEMNKLNHYQHSGHCYPDLVQKENGKVIAQMRSTIWSGNFQRINRNFLQTLNEPLKDGIKILFLAKIDFDPVHGLSLHIEDIDSSFTLGDLEKEKQETIQRLKKEGLYDLNRKLPLPVLPQRIAIISVESSKGYLDFTRILNENAWGYSFFHLLFPSLLQGDKAVDAILGQLKRIRTVLSHFDVVAIIRGGGGDVGLACYNDYRLASEIATFPLPVLTGIGHSTNQTVVEMIAGINAITPTDMADILLQKFHNFAVPVQQALETIKSKPQDFLMREQTDFRHRIKYFRQAYEKLIIENLTELKSTAGSLTQATRLTLLKENTLSRTQSFQLQKFSEHLVYSARVDFEKNFHEFRKETLTKLKQEKIRLDSMETNLKHLDPTNVLRRGFSITRLKGKSVSSTDQISEKDILETILFEGKLTSIVTQIEKKQDK